MTVAKIGLPPISAQEPPRQDSRNPKVLEAARMYEGQFLRQMLAEMRKTVPESEFMPESQAEKIFREQLDEQSVDNWVDRGGVGMADLIYDQVMEKFFNSQGMQYKKGPMPLNNEVKLQPLALKKEDVTFKVQSSKSFDVVAPWDGKVVATQSLDHGLSSLLLDHGTVEGKSLKSSLVYKGSLLIPELTEVKAGQRLGLLNPSNDGVLWRVQTL